MIFIASIFSVLGYLAGKVLVKPPMDHKVKRPYGPWVPSQDTDIRKTFERAREQDARSQQSPSER
jgi:hypothetical protein